MENKGHAGRGDVKKEETEMQHSDAAEMNSSFVRDKAEWPKDENMALKSQPNAESQVRCKSIFKIYQLFQGIIKDLLKHLSIPEQDLDRWAKENAKKQLLADWKVNILIWGYLQPI